GVRWMKGGFILGNRGVYYFDRSGALRKHVELDQATASGDGSRIIYDELNCEGRAGVLFGPRRDGIAESSDDCLHVYRLRWPKHDHALEHGLDRMIARWAPGSDQIILARSPTVRILDGSTGALVHELNDVFGDA